MFNIPFHNYLLLIVVGLSLFTYMRAKGQFDGLLLLYLLLTLAIETAGLVAWKIFKYSSNNIIYNPYVIMQGILLFALYSKMYSTRRLKSFALFLIAPYCAFGLINLFFLQGLKVFNTYTVILLSIFAISLSCCYFFELIKSTSVELVFTNRFFWMATAFFLFFLAMLFYWGTWEYLIIKKVDYKGKLFYYINQIANFVMYSLIAIGLLCKRKT